MKTKQTKVTGVSLTEPLPGNAHHTNDMHISIDADDKNVSILAVRSIANEYRISEDIFKNWLIRERGYTIVEEARG